jgi:hypothetical protein
VPAGGGFVRSTWGSRGSRHSVARSGFVTPGEPFTTTSPRKASNFVPRSCFVPTRSRSGCASMKVVSHLPVVKSSCSITFSRKPMLVFTPRMRNSCRQRSITRAACANSSPQVETFTSNES